LIRKTHLATIKKRIKKREISVHQFDDNSTFRDRLYISMRNRWRVRGLYMLVLPSIVAVFIFSYMPLFGILLAFRKYEPAKGLFLSPWAKPLFYNFWFLKDKEFWYVLGNTIKISLAKFAIGFPAPILLALFINEMRNKYYKRVVQTLTYMPHFVSWVIMAGIIYKLFHINPDSPFNALRGVFGAEPMEILANPDMFIPLVAISNVFKEVGWGTIIYLAAIMGVDPQLYESAIIDGAGRIRQTWSITMPTIVPVITILFILWVPSILTENLSQIYNLMNTRTLRVASITDIYVLTAGIIRGEYAYATAMGLIFGIWGLCLTALANFVSKRTVGHGLW
jgi:putative aldouronate transport system permease protein